MVKSAVRVPYIHPLLPPVNSSSPDSHAEGALSPFEKRSTRCSKILAVLDEREVLTVDEACQVFGVSPATIRRDFVFLVAAGKAEKTWGGLRSLEPHFTDVVPSGMRRQLYTEGKRRLAARASQLVSDGDCIFVDGGTTTMELARWFADRPLRIITNSLLFAFEIDRLRSGNSGPEMFVTGGYVYPQSGHLVGPDVVASIAKYHVQTAFISVGGISEEGITNNHPLIVEVERAMMKNARRNVLVADRSKFGHREMIAECSWDEFDLLVTDSAPPQEYCERAGKRLIIAE